MSSDEPEIGKGRHVCAMSLGRALGSRTSLPTVRRRLQVLVRAARLGERIDGALDHAQLAGGDAREQVAQRLGDHLARAPQAVHQPEADDACERAISSRWRPCCGSREAIPYVTSRPKPGQRLQRLVEHAAAGHLEHDVDRLAAVGLEQRAAEVLARDVDRRVGARDRARAAASPRSTRWRSRGRRRTPCRAGPPASRRPGRRVHDRALARDSRADVRYRCHAVSPWTAAPAPARR